MGKFDELIKELNIDETKTTPIKKSKYIQDDIGVQYLTIYVNSITPFLKRIKSNNIKLLGQTPTTTGDKQYVLIQDPNGVFIELIEH